MISAFWTSDRDDKVFWRRLIKGTFIYLLQTTNQIKWNAKTCLEFCEFFCSFLQVPKYSQPFSDFLAHLSAGQSKGLQGLAVLAVPPLHHPCHLHHPRHSRWQLQLLSSRQSWHKLAAWLAAVTHYGKSHWLHMWHRLQIFSQPVLGDLLSIERQRL